MMSFMNFDLAKALTEERTSRALASFERRRLLAETTEVSVPQQDAEVIELVFGTRCEPDQIGA